jgi:Xaa-Pro aminopeptidase
MFKQVPVTELNARLARFIGIMNSSQPQWEMAIIINKINLYYFTGTMQEGMLIVPREGEPVLWVRRSYERAISESPFTRIRPMESFRDAAAAYPAIPENMHLETSFIPVTFMKLLQKYFPFQEALSLDNQVALARSVKSAYELNLIRKSGELHRIVLEEKVPELLREGMSEVDLAGALYEQMLQLGHHGVARFGMFDTEIGIGHIAFGESSLYPTSFNGPGGNYGMSPAVPHIGNRNRKLKKGDLVFVDIGFGVDGYHTDKTLNYIFGGKPDQEVLEEHKWCVNIQDRLASQLKPGVIPSVLYEETMNNLAPGFLKNFMGFGNRQVKFLGHGVGLIIDEVPVIAKGFDAPFEENMVMALEPKKGIEKVGVVGIENTFIVTPLGGECVTGHSRGLVVV